MIRTTEVLTDLNIQYVYIVSIVSLECNTSVQNQHYGKHIVRGRVSRESLPGNPPRHINEEYITPAVRSSKQMLVPIVWVHEVARGACSRNMQQQSLSDNSLKMRLWYRSSICANVRKNKRVTSCNKLRGSLLEYRSVLRQCWVEEMELWVVSVSNDSLEPSLGYR